MKTYRIPHSDLNVSRIAYGCMGIGGEWNRQPPTAAEQSIATQAVMTAVEQGLTLFDHADIYAIGKSETVFGEILRSVPELREKIVLQTKCGIRFADDPVPSDPGRYDFSYQHIVDSVHGSLKRLRTDFVEILLLHRPDPLIEPDEVARAFGDLHRAGKVGHFGVSNHTAAQIALLQKSVEQPLVINQLELSLLHAHLINDGIIANQVGTQPTGAAGTLDYCRLNNILVQAWSPVAGGRLSKLPADADAKLRETAEVANRIASEKGVTVEALLLAWLLRHPAGIQPIIGTTHPARITTSCAADAVELTREEWYTLFTTARGQRVP